MKKISAIMTNLSILIISLICLFLVGEIVYRTYCKLRLGIPFTAATKMFLDKELGWKSKKVFGDPESEKYKIFITGDSYTDGGRVPENDMYYSVIEKELDAEIFVYAAVGYGTLQEYLVIDRYFDEIKPDLVILQACGNDFINNSWELERASSMNNNLMIRPYLIDGEIEYLYPKFPSKLRVFLSSHSRLFYFLMNKTDKLLLKLAKRDRKSIRHYIWREGLNFDKFAKSVTTTENLMTKIKDRVGDVPIVVFAVGDPHQQFAEILQASNIEYIGNVEKPIREEEKKTGIKMRLKDGGHWDKAGHRLCGEILTEELKKRGYTK